MEKDKMTKWEKFKLFFYKKQVYFNSENETDVFFKKMKGKIYIVKIFSYSSPRTMKIKNKDQLNWKEKIIFYFIKERSFEDKSFRYTFKRYKRIVLRLETISLHPPADFFNCRCVIVGINNDT